MSSRRSGAAPFFALTFAFTWALQVPGVLAQRGLLPGDPKVYLPAAGLGMLGPLFAATVLAHREGGGAAVRALYAPLLRWRVHPGWYLLALVVPGAALAGILALLNLAGRNGPVGYFPVLGGVVFAVFASVVEEVGWRGYAQPRLQERWGAFAAASLIGVMWCLWHIPMNFGLGMPMNLLLVELLLYVGASLLLARMYNSTGGSLLVVVMAHVGAHLNNSHRAVPGEVLPLVVHAIVYAALGLFVMRRSVLAVRRVSTGASRGGMGLAQSR